MMAEKRLQRMERNKLKKEANESDRANNADHKLPENSSGRFSDKLLKAGRGCASGGVPVDDDSPQETAKENGCPAEPSPEPPETTGEVMVKATEKLLGRFDQHRAYRLWRCRAGFGCAAVLLRCLLRGFAIR